ncbi:MAG: DUF1295 domain-containing protein [Rhodococcus sp. (in: high G+C Gram-positive bacteria)]
MDGFDLGNFAVVTSSSLAAVVVILTVTAVIGFRIGRHNVVDVSWGAGFVAVALTAAFTGSGDGWRRILLLVLVGAWGTRLAVSMFRRSRGKGEDPRYEKMLSNAPGNPALYAVRKIYLTQAAALWFVSLPVQVSAAATGSFGIVATLGVIVWLVGIVFETVGDKQMDDFKADPSTEGIMDRGLWRYTRHPNYFGDACVWWGIFLISAAQWPGVLTVLSPVAMTYFLVFATGARLMEQHMAERDGYREYQERTSYFIPLPPRKK